MQFATRLRFALLARATGPTMLTDLRPAAVLAVAAVATMFADLRSSAQLAPAALPAMLTYLRTPTSLARAAYSAVWTNRGPSAVLADGLEAAVRADRGTTTHLTCSTLGSVAAVSLPLVSPHPPPLEAAVLQHDLFVPVALDDWPDLGDSARPLTLFARSWGSPRPSTTAAARATTGGVLGLRTSFVSVIGRVDE